MIELFSFFFFISFFLNPCRKRTVGVIFNIVSEAP